jgi:hypothetical protein
MTMVSLVMGGFVSAAVFARHVPLFEQADPRVASVVGLLQTAIVTAVLGLVMLLFVLMNTSPSAAVIVSWLKVLVTGVAAAVAARFGADAAAGWIDGRGRRLVMAGIGSVLGAVVTMVGLLLSGATSGDPGVSEAPNLYFLPLVVSAAVVASAAAGFESRPPVKPPFTKQVATLAATVAGLSVVFGLAASVRGMTLDTDDVVEGATKIGPATREMPAEGRIESPLAAHARLTFTVEFRQLVRIHTENPGGRDLELRLINARTGALVERVDDPDPPKYSNTLDEGTYLVEVGRYGTFGGSSGGFLKLPVENILRTIFVTRSAETSAAGSPEDAGTFAVSVVLNGPPEG